MLVIGDIRKGTDVGKNNISKYIWWACEECGRERWVQYRNKAPSPMQRICIVCHNKKIAHLQGTGPNHKRWKGGRQTDRDGYIRVWVSSDDDCYPMTHTKWTVGGVLLEHRLVMARHLGRLLHSWEEVHHKNGIKSDNRIENLELTTKGSHSHNHGKGYRDGYLQGYYDGKGKRIKELEAKNKQLREQLGGLYG